ncbi:hypothetical protein KFZ58_07135 [Virgibacillus sp. NKC19-16]|uniref:hypothetical protein n=1 Tax=Virgibacillus salidurans TaxID=2831673 RepID=UPI001F4560CA|nr:hypothetical protein [Virgibacillus sp. NKC19-16]UJL47631.1 hypothetical protein KFZ58_07135 [Virgibacillus sp. NKC19-16]
MQRLLPFFFLLLTIFALVLNIFGLMQIIPLYITLPLLFLSLYLTIYSFTNRRMYRGHKMEKRPGFTKVRG